jgi:hypothetical protein
VFVNIAPADFVNGNRPVAVSDLENEVGWVKLPYAEPVGLANPEEASVPEGGMDPLSVGPPTADVLFKNTRPRTSKMVCVQSLR